LIFLSAINTICAGWASYALVPLSAIDAINPI
jgi:hypothetical protein